MPCAQSVGRAEPSLPALSFASRNPSDEIKQANRAKSSRRDVLLPQLDDHECSD